MKKDIDKQFDTIYNVAKEKQMRIGVQNFSHEKLNQQLAAKDWKFATFVNRLYSASARTASPIYPSHTHVKRHLSGENKPTPNYLKLYCRVLGCSMKDLLNGQ